MAPVGGELDPLVIQESGSQLYTGPNEDVEGRQIGVALFYVLQECSFSPLVKTSHGRTAPDLVIGEPLGEAAIGPARGLT